MHIVILIKFFFLGCPESASALSICGCIQKQQFVAINGQAMEMQRWIYVFDATHSALSEIYHKYFVYAYVWFMIYWFDWLALDVGVFELEE